MNDSKPPTFEVHTTDAQPIGVMDPDGRWIMMSPDADGIVHVPIEYDDEGRATTPQITLFGGGGGGGVDDACPACGTTGPHPYGGGSAGPWELQRCRNCGGDVWKLWS